LSGATLYAAWAFGITFLVFSLVSKFKRMRVAPEVEEEGLDVPEFSMPGYPKDGVVSAPY
jgi:ammonia channel protein AmtB